MSMHQSISARDCALTQLITTKLLAHGEPGRYPARICGDRYGYGVPSVRAMLASVAAAGGLLIQNELYSAEIIDALRPLTVVRKHVPAANLIPLPHGNMTIGRADTAPAGGWVGENVAQEVAAPPTFGAVTMQAKKCWASVPVSNGLLRYGGAPEIEGIIRDQLLKKFASIEDNAFLTGDGTQFGLKGIRSSAATVTEATQDYSVTTVLGDLSGLILALETANVPMRSPVWFTSPKVKEYLRTAVDSVGAFMFPTVSDGHLMGYPLESTNNVPSNLGHSSNQSEIYCVDMAEFLLGQAYLEVTLHDGATYTDSDGNKRNVFDRDETLVRLMAAVDCALRHAAAAACLTLVPWGN